MNRAIRYRLKKMKEIINDSKTSRSSLAIKLFIFLTPRQPAINWFHSCYKHGRHSGRDHHHGLDPLTLVLLILSD